MSSITMPNGGRVKMYTSGWPKNQKRFSHRYGLPPLDEMKNEVLRVRSRACMLRAAARIGAANVPRIEAEKTPQTNIGKRVQVMPGARRLMIVVSMLTPETQSARPISVNPT